MFLSKKSIKSDEKAISKEFGCRIVEIDDIIKGGWISHIGQDFDFTGRIIFRLFKEDEFSSTIKIEKSWYKKGSGIIIFPRDFQDSNSNIIHGLLNWFKNDFESVRKRINGIAKLQKPIPETESENADKCSFAYSVGNFFIGNYEAQGKVFDKNSATIEVLGFPPSFITPIAAEIAKKFQQETIMVKDWSRNKFLLISRGE
jgi:hypothetical protein